MNATNKLDIILEFGRVMSQETNIEFILKEISNFSKSLIQAQRCSLFIYDKNNHELWTKIADGLNSEIRIQASQGIIGHVLKTKEPEIVNDTYNNPRFNNKIDEQTGYKTEKIIAIPLLDANKECIAVLQLLNKKDGDFTQEDLNYLRIISNYAAATLKNALLLELETTLIQQSKLAEMGTMLDNILHQWKQPLNIISIAASTSKFSLKTNDYEKTELIESLDEIVNQITFMDQTSKNFRNFLMTKTKKEEFFIYTIVEKVLGILNYHIQNLHIKVEKNYDETAKSYGISNDYAQVILSIINNAIDKFEEKDDLNIIKIDISKKEKKVILKISDNAGIIKEELLPNKLFNRYITTKESGSGLGLAISNTIINKKFDGKIIAYNENDFACFEIEVNSASEKL